MSILTHERKKEKEKKVIFMLYTLTILQFCQKKWIGKKCAEAYHYVLFPPDRCHRYKQPQQHR